MNEMKTGRLEAFSDGVLAIIITIMVLELKAPETAEFSALLPRIPLFIGYLISFIYLGIYWNNHHHLFQLAERVNGKILWANLHLLFWLSLIPFTTAWIGEHHSATAPVVLYGFILFMSALAFKLLQGSIIKHHDADFPLKKAIGTDIKGKLSVFLYLAGMLSAFANTWPALAIYLLVALMWLSPDRRLRN